MMFGKGSIVAIGDFAKVVIFYVPNRAKSDMELGRHTPHPWASFLSAGPDSDDHPRRSPPPQSAATAALAGCGQPGQIRPRLLDLLLLAPPPLRMGCAALLGLRRSLADGRRRPCAPPLSPWQHAASLGNSGLGRIQSLSLASPQLGANLVASLWSPAARRRCAETPRPPPWPLLSAEPERSPCVGSGCSTTAAAVFRRRPA
uniref:Uncharacterized protein n=1 Tax=Ananas comosus var. bracteatus TaxID=296719 RepID=A0A6V7PGY8_ANACO|nr:unnamed protein product [Ananas comosus var. bracteatus]